MYRPLKQVNAGSVPTSSNILHIRSGSKVKPHNSAGLLIMSNKDSLSGIDKGKVPSLSQKANLFHGKHL